MIRMERSVLRRFRTALRKTFGPGARAWSGVPVLILSGPQGRTLFAARDAMALAWRDAEPGAPSRALLPASALQELEGSVGSVNVQAKEAGTVVQWDEDGIPQRRVYPVVEGPEGLPALPESLVAPGPEFLPALAEAVATTARQGVRFALHKVQVRGAAGELVASDGRQLLCQKGLRFPWSEDLLLPSLAIFSWPELRRGGPVELGRTEQHVCLKVGAWTVWLVPDRESRFPTMRDVIPRASFIASRLRVDARDAEFLVRALPHLPESAETSAVTLDLDGAVRVRARDTSNAGMEVLLSRCEAVGEPRRVATSRRYLARALRLGFSEIGFVNDDAPILCEDSRRCYVWMPLAKSAALLAQDHDVRVASDAGDARVHSRSTRKGFTAA